MTVINTNIKALYAENALKSTAKDSLKANMQLATGKRINSSADDPAGMAVASRMTQNIKSLGQAISNTGSAMSLIQTVDSAAASITTMLQRMNELALQASNGSMSTDQRGYLDVEFQQLKLEISRTAATQEWNGFPIMNGTAGEPVGLPSYTTMDRPVATVAGGTAAAVLAKGDLSIVTGGHTYLIPPSIANSNDPSSSAASMSQKAASAIAIATAINSQSAITGVSAVPNPAVIEGAKTTVRSTSINTNLYVNGQKITLNLPAGQTEAERRAYVMDSINATSDLHGVTAIQSGSGGLKLSTPDGRNLSVWYDSTTASPAVTAADFGLGLDTLSPSDAPGVTKCLEGDRLEATRETVALTFIGLTAGQTVTVNGLTFTSTGATTASQVAAAFANLSSGMTAAQATAANSTSAGLGSFAGTFTAGFSTGTNTSATLTATATADNVGNVGSILTLPVPTVVTTSGATPVTESSVVTFNALTAGQSVTVNGLTYTSAGATTAAQVAAAFANLSSGMSYTLANTALAAGTSAGLGTFTGTFTAGFTTGAVSGSTVTATSTTASSNVTDIVTSGTTVAATVATTAGVSVVTESSVITFSDLTAGQSVTVNGLTYTSAGATTAAQVAAAFANLSSGMSYTLANTALAAGTSAGLGTFTGTFTAGFTTGAVSGSTVTATSTAASSNVTDIGYSGTLTSVVTASGVSGVTESSVVTFNALTAGQSVTVNGLTYTSAGATTAAQVAAAFANLSSGMSYTLANTALAAGTSAGLGTFTGTFTAGFTTGAVSGSTVTATSTTASSNVTDIVTSGTSVAATVATTSGVAGVTETSVLSFSSLSAGQSITVNGLQFTSTGKMTAEQVAAAYASLTSGMTATQAATANTASSALGTYSGTFTAGFTTGPVSGSSVTATSTTASSNVTDIIVSSTTSFPTEVQSDGLNVLASTVYGTVTLKSENSFTISGSSDSLRTQLGFENLAVKKEDIGRLSFQVGADSSQTVTVDIGDFGKNGNITGAITSDSAATAISTVIGARNVMDLMNTALNAVAAQRSNMGSLINRLQEISDNLTNVQTNEVASRSQIEDADFALASTAASKAKIMTEAATAILAQANADMQTVLKLLQ